MYGLLISDEDSLHTWGHNKFGCLGLAHVNDQFFPYKVSPPVGYTYDNIITHVHISNNDKIS